MKQTKGRTHIALAPIILEGERLSVLEVTGTSLSIGGLSYGGNIYLNRGVSLYSGGGIFDAAHSLVNAVGL
jgi:hypothetical protein